MRYDDANIFTNESLLLINDEIAFRCRKIKRQTLLKTRLRGMEWFIQVKLSKLLRASELFNFFSNFYFGNTKLLDNFVTKWLESVIII